VLRQRTAALAHENVPFGEFTPANWHEAFYLLKRWTYNHQLSHSPESVDQSFLLLDRLVVEQEVQQYHPLSLDMLITPVLRSMVYNWFQCVEHFHTYSADDQALLRYEFTPMELLARLEDYSDRSPRLQLDTKCLNTIIAGAQRCSLVSPAGEPGVITFRVAIPFAESLFDRMASRSVVKEEDRHRDHNSNYSEYSNNAMDHGYGQTNAPAGTTAAAAAAETKPATPQDDMTDFGFPHLDHSTMYADENHSSNSLPPLGQHQKRRHSHRLPSTRPDLFTYTALIKMFAANGLAPRAEAMLNRLYRDYQETGKEELKPDVNVFTSVILAWSKSGNPNAAHRADIILKRMQELSECGIVAVAPDQVVYAVVLSCWAKVAGISKKQDTKESCIHRAKELFEEMESLGYVNTMAYNVMMDLYAKTQDPLAAEELLKRMQKEYAEGNENVRPTSYTYNTLLVAWTRCRQDSSSDRAEAILKEFEEHFQSGLVADAPNLLTYNSVLQCLAVSGEAHRAETLLEKMKQLKTAHGENIYPDRVTYNIVINAYAEAKNPRRAESLLETLYQEYAAIEGKNTHMAPSVTTFTTVLKAWLRSGDAHAPVRADAIFRTMQNLHDANVLDVAPNAISYNIMVSCWCSSQHPKAPKRALELLDQMERQFNGGNSSVRPDEYVYDSIIKLLANNRLINRADDTLERMHLQSLPMAMGGMGNLRAKPLARSYKRVLGGCGRCGDSRRAESVWDRWQDRFENTLIDEAPDEVATQLVLEACLNGSGSDPQAGKRAKAFIEKVQKKYDSGDLPTEVRLKSHMTLLEIFQKLNDAPSAHDYFIALCERCMKDKTSKSKPSTEMLNLVLATWRLSGSPLAVEKVEELLSMIDELNQKGVLKWKPALASYRTLLNCLEEERSLQAGEKARAILEKLEELSVERDEMKPEARDYAQVCRIWFKVATTTDPEAIVLADAAFHRMLDADFTPSPSLFSTIINGWSLSKHENSKVRIQMLEEQLAKLHDGQKLKPAGNHKNGALRYGL